LAGDPSIGLRVKIDKDIEFEDGIEAEFEEGKAIVPTGVAPKYLLDALKVCELEDKICISGTEPTAPMTVGLAEGRDSMVAVVMPMRL
jgi:DNA polymerase III sliding clamp (beta) subunit (PCNA family)